jgi:HPt (histidine-containing phosphotransfer) domain-containing protein
VKSGSSGKNARRTGDQAGAGQPAVLSLAEALQRCDGDRDFLVSIVRVFRQNLPRGVANLQSAVEARDARRLEIQAHALAGIAATLAAGDLRQAALQLERLGASREWRGAPEALQEVLDAVDRLEAALEREQLID